MTRLERMAGDALGSDYGWAYGSNKSLSTRTPVADLGTKARYSLDYRYGWYLWKADGGKYPEGYIDKSSTQGFPLGHDGDWSNCTDHGDSACLAKVSHTSACGTKNDRWNLALLELPHGIDRRNVREYWCKENAVAIGEDCYTGNSHVDAMMQIVDDDGAFLGWVGVEASIGQSPGAITWPNDQIGFFEITDPHLSF